MDVDAVILDLHLGEEDGSDLFHRLTALDPNLPVILMTATRGYQPPPFGPRCAALLEKPRARKARLPAVSSGGLLTERERDVLRWVSRGASNKVVAQKLSISPSTVRTHIESVFRKLECSTRAAATLKATHLGLL